MYSTAEHDKPCGTGVDHAPLPIPRLASLVKLNWHNPLEGSNASVVASEAWGIRLACEATQCRGA